MVWLVMAPTAGYHHGSLAGLYQGATAEATLGLGVGANVLTAAPPARSTSSGQPQGQVGLNVAATGTSMTLTSSTRAFPAKRDRFGVGQCGQNKDKEHCR